MLKNWVRDFRQNIFSFVAVVFVIIRRNVITNTEPSEKASMEKGRHFQPKYLSGDKMDNLSVKWKKKGKMCFLLWNAFGLLLEG